MRMLSNYYSYIESSLPPSGAAFAFSISRSTVPAPRLLSDPRPAFAPRIRSIVAAGSLALLGVAPAGAALPLPAAAPLDADGSWRSVPPPSGRHSHTAIYDPARDRMIVLGGDDGHRRNDTWVVSFDPGPTWQRMLPAGTPPAPTFGHSAIYDPVRDRMVVFGGDENDVPNGIWELSLAGDPTWSLLTPAGALPAGLEYQTAIYDPVRDRLIVFGGTDGTSRHAELWALPLADPSAWSALAASGVAPAARERHAAVYDPVRDRMIVLGGLDAVPLGDVWALSLSGTPEWSQLVPAGASPKPRYGHAAVYDPAGDRIVMLGGSDGDSLLADAWALSLADPQWTELDPSGTGPSARYRHSAVYDPVLGRAVVFGGSDPNRENDLWALALDGTPAWSELIDLGTPIYRLGHTAIYDPLRDRMVVFGGQTAGSYTERADARQLTLSGDMKWSGIAVPTPAPARSFHAAIYDPVRDRMVVFGGMGAADEGLNDTWALALSGSPAWSRIVTAGGSPPALFLPKAIYDPPHDRMIVIGSRAVSPYENATEVWALSLSDPPEWTRLTPAGPGPDGRFTASPIFDAIRERLLLLAHREDPAGGGRWIPELWALPLGTASAWIQLDFSGAAPDAERGSAIYDPVRDRMVVLGGAGSPFYSADAWALSLAGAPTWTRLAPAGAPAGPLFDHSTIYDPVRDRAVVFGGFYTGDETWSLEWNQPLRPSVACPDTVRGTGSVTGRYLLTNPAPSDRAIGWELTSTRGWPQFPLRGIEVVAGSTTKPFVVQVPIPDSAAAGGGVLAFSASFAGGEGYDADCSQSVLDPATSVLASLLSASARAGSIDLAWFVTTPEPLFIQRRTAATPWSRIAEVHADGQGRIAFTDRGVQAGDRYGYRLEWNSPAGEAFAGEVWVDVPLAPQWSLAGVRPNPAAGAMTVAFALPRDGKVMLELFDMRGRRLGPRQVVALAAGSHVLPVPLAGRIAPGIYTVRLTFETRTLAARAIVVR